MSCLNGWSISNYHLIARGLLRTRDVVERGHLHASRSRGYSSGHHNGRGWGWLFEAAALAAVSAGGDGGSKTDEETDGDPGDGAGVYLTAIARRFGAADVGAVAPFVRLFLQRAARAGVHVEDRALAVVRIGAKRARRRREGEGEADEQNGIGGGTHVARGASRGGVQDGGFGTFGAFAVATVGMTSAEVAPEKETQIN